MTIYHWENAPLASMRIEHKKGYPTAYIQLSVDANASDYANWPQKLQAQGIEAIPDSKDGVQSLRVVGFKNDHELIHRLQSVGAIDGPASRIEQDEKKREFSAVAGAQQWVVDHSLVAAGISYLVADGLVFASGYVRGDKNGMQGGLVWAATSAMLALFGTRDPHQQMQNLYANMRDHLTREGVKLDGPEADALRQLQGDPEAFYNRAQQFIYEHPIEINNLLQGWGGVQILLAGLNQKQINMLNPIESATTPNYFKVMAGFCVAAGMWSGLLIKEDVEAGLTPEQKAQRFMDRLQGKEPAAVPDADPFTHPIEWVKQKPLRVSGWGAFVNNILIGTGAAFFERPQLGNYFRTGGVRDEFSAKLQAEEVTVGNMAQGEAKMHAWTELRDKKAAFSKVNEAQRQRVWGNRFDLATPLPNMIANKLYAMSPKDRTGTLKEDGYLDELYALAANIFREMPEDVRSERLEKFAGFMATQPDMKSSIVEIENAVKQRMAEIADNPWVKAGVSHDGAPRKADAPTPVADVKDSKQPQPQASRFVHLGAAQLPPEVGTSVHA